MKQDIAFIGPYCAWPRATHGRNFTRTIEPRLPNRPTKTFRQKRNAKLGVLATIGFVAGFVHCILPILV